jgi:hypothetical protein
MSIFVGTYVGSLIGVIDGGEGILYVAPFVNPEALNLWLLLE